MTLIAPSFRKTYDGRPLGGETKGLNQIQAIGLPEDYTVEATTTGSQTDAGMGVNLVNEDYIIRDAEGNDRTADFPNVTLMSGTLTVLPRPLTIFTGSASKVYDGAELQSPATEIQGLVRDESVTLKATGFIDDVGRVLNGCAITWSGAKPGNYVVTKRLGYLEITPNDQQIVLSAASAQKAYDGRPLTRPEVIASGLPEGFTLEASASGSQTTVGLGKNLVDEGFVIRDARGNDRTANFTNILKVAGDLTVHPRALTLRTVSGEKTYDGRPLRMPEAQIEGLVPGESVTLLVTGELRDVGSYSNTCEIVWDHASPSNYRMSQQLGTLTITKNDQKVMLTASSADKVYDGTPLESHGVSVTGLPEGMRLEAQAVGCQTDSGSSVNAVEAGFRILNAEEEDKTEYFTNIELVEGVLTVTPRPVTITTGSETIPYDGMALTSEKANISGLVQGESVTLTATGTITEIGSVPNTYEITWDNAREANYQVTEKLGLLTVTANSDPIILTAASLSKTYDGKPLQPGEGSVMVTGLPEGLQVDVWSSGSQLNVGTSLNQVDKGFRILNEEGQDRTENFIGVTLVDGRLTVNRRAVTILTGSASKGYDGTPLTDPTAVIEGLVEGESVTIHTTGTITEAGTTPNTYEIDWDHARSENYIVTENLGLLTVAENRSRRRGN